MGTKLKKGSLIGIAAASSPFDENLFNAGVTVLKKIGFEVFFRKDLFAKAGYLAGDDQRRAEELTELLSNKKIEAVFFARGGYGAQRIIPLLPVEKIKKFTPKPLIGFSDVTALLTFFRQNFSYPTLYAPSLTLLGNSPTERTIDSLRRHLTDNKPIAPLPLTDDNIFREGKVSGELTGGCLSLLTTSIGTPYQLKADGKILFIEDVNEKGYAIDRMLTQMKNGGHLKDVKGILIGTMQTADGVELVSILKRTLADFAGPIVTGIPSGHDPDFISLPLGRKITVDTPNKKLIFEEPLLT
ncbi:MAG: LD-carboxypeptidase [Deltaproteobacteria bacterium]|nr:LD-carboxypeptidase [Deltaproteobacteria bacterium]